MRKTLKWRRCLRRPVNPLTAVANPVSGVVLLFVQTLSAGIGSGNTEPRRVFTILTGCSY
jgi:hypothetical protein